MKKKKLVLISSLVVNIVICFTGCNVKRFEFGQSANRSTTYEYNAEIRNEPTQRELELATLINDTKTYETLSDTEKQQVTAIEDMLEYLETRYQDEFHFYTYYPETDSNWETIHVYWGDSYSENSLVAVWRKQIDGRWCYSDDLVATLNQTFVEDAFKSFMDNQIIFENYKFYTIVYSSDADWNKDNVMSKSSVASQVHVNVGTVSKESAMMIIDNYKEWLMGQNPTKDFSFVIVGQNKEQYEVNNENSIQPQIDNDEYEYCIECLYSDGVFSINEI